MNFAWCTDGAAERHGPKQKDIAIDYQQPTNSHDEPYEQERRQTQSTPLTAHERKRPRELPPVAGRIDRVLLEIDEQVNWLMALSPLHHIELWEAFVDSGYKQVPTLRYAPLDYDLDATHQRLHELPVSDIESPLLEALLVEKQRELDRQIELVRLRGTEGFVQASIDLFGCAEPQLVQVATRILENTPRDEPLPADATAEDYVAAAEAELDWYREQSADFEGEVRLVDDLHSMMMVTGHTLYVDRHSRMPTARIQPLVQHEVGTHILTNHNGMRQPLHQLAAGLAHFDALQEGLGALSEYLCGYLPPERLRIIAARVIAADQAVAGWSIPDIYHCLHGEYELPENHAFDTAVRALRGGGLTKDAVYLRGLQDLLAWLANGGLFEDLLLGKYALAQLPSLKQLVAEGLIHGPDLMPGYLNNKNALARLDRCRELSVEDLYQKEPES